MNAISMLLLLLFILTANEFLPGGSRTKIWCVKSVTSLRMGGVVTSASLLRSAAAFS
jgi:hypothetical protein